MNTIKTGLSGIDVVKLQNCLKSLGYDLGSSGSDGIFGTVTEDTVKTFQRDQGLIQDGIVGPITWNSIIKICPDSFGSDEMFGTEIWLDGTSIDSTHIVRIPGVNGPRFISLPWRGVLHTTEIETFDNTISSFRRENFWPHFTIDPNPIHPKIAQHISLHIGARALSDHNPTLPENAANCIQIEIVGFASQSPFWTREKLNIIKELMRDIEVRVPIPHTIGSLQFLDQNGVNHNPSNRMTAEQWRQFSGWCEHQHVPGEGTRWDPGKINTRVLFP